MPASQRLYPEAAAQPPAGQQPKEKQTGTAGKGDPDTSFVRQAAVGGMAEVELGRLATQNAASADVKQFGQRMVDVELVLTSDTIPSLDPAAVLVADRWGEVQFAVSGLAPGKLPAPAELAEWIEYVRSRCPECEGESR